MTETTSNATFSAIVDTLYESVMTELNVDSSRYDSENDPTGIFVRAKFNGHWLSVDIAHLDKESLLEWLRSRGGKNPWAEDTVGILLGHGNW